MLPFVAGHLLRPWIGGFIGRHAATLKYVDQGSVLLVVYTAFSAAVVGGLWRELPLPALAGLLVVCAVILGLVLFKEPATAARLVCIGLILAGIVGLKLASPG